MQHNLWVTRYDPKEMFAAGDYMYQSADMQGLPEFVADDAPLEDTDVVLWYTLGAHHVVRPEDWPVMPCAYTGFHLKPIGFFDATRRWTFRRHRRRPAMRTMPGCRSRNARRSPENFWRHRADRSPDSQFQRHVFALLNTRVTARFRGEKRLLTFLVPHRESRRQQPKSLFLVLLEL